MQAKLLQRPRRGVAYKRPSSQVRETVKIRKHPTTTGAKQGGKHEQKNVPFLGWDDFDYTTFETPWLNLVHVSLEIVELVQRWFENGNTSGSHRIVIRAEITTWRW